jgi:type I restriction enzyme, S subunit
MSDWVDSTIGQVTIYQRAGGTPSVSNDKFYGDGVPFVVIEDMTKVAQYLDGTSKEITKAGLDSSAAWLIKESHILYSMYATVGKPVISRIPCATNQAIIALKENDEILQLYLYYALEFIRPSVWKFTAQTTQVNLNASVVRMLPVKYPKCKKQQQKIARILQTVDQAIEKTEQLIGKYQQIKAGLMHDLFTRGIGADGQLRPPREQAPELYQHTPIGWIPKEWYVKTIESLAANYKGSTVIGPFGSDLVMSDYRDEGVPVVFVRDVKEDGFHWVSDVYVSESKALRLSAHKVCSGDLLATKMGLPPCVACVYPEGMDNGIITADMIRMTPNKELIEVSWLALALNQDRAKRQVAAITAGVTRPKITLGDFRQLRVAVPDLDEQLQIKQAIEHQERLVTAEKKKVEALRKQKSGLMHDLLTGTVPVSVDSASEVSA